MKIALLLTALVAIALAASPEYPCTYGDYDLSKMYRDSSQDDYSWAGSSSGHTFYINICGVIKEPCEPSYNAGSCQYDGNAWYSAGDASTGTFSDYPIAGVDGVTLTYSNGQICNGVARVTTIEVKYDASAGDGQILQIDETVSCRYTVSMSSKYAKAGGGTPPLPPLPEKTFKGIAEFSAQVFATTVWPDPLTGIEGTGTLSYIGANAGSQLLLNATDRRSNKPMGVLSLSPIRQVLSLPGYDGCAFTQAYPPVHNITEVVVGYLGNFTYTYVYFNAGTKVAADAWYGSVWTASGDPFDKDDDDDDDEGYRPVLLTDPSSGDVIWASGSLFYGATTYEGKLAMPFGFKASYEVKPGSYSTKAGPMELPSSWDC